MGQCLATIVGACVGPQLLTGAGLLAVQALIKAELQWNDAGRPVYLLGESFGGIMSLALAYKLGDLVDRLVLVNPASSFNNSIWPAAGPLLAQVGCQSTAPVLHVVRGAGAVKLKSSGAGSVWWSCTLCHTGGVVFASS